MAHHATVYAPLRFFPSAEHLLPFAPGASVTVDAKQQRASISWPDLSVSLTRMPDEDMGAHLLGFQEFVRQKGAGEALAIRVLSTLSVYGVSVEPDLDPAQRALSLIVGVTQATLGLCLTEGELLDEHGTSLFQQPPKPPIAKQVAARALVLLLLAMRGLVEEDAGQADEAQAEAFRERIVSYTQSYPELIVELEPAEEAFLRTPIGRADPQEVVDAVWRAEGAQVLLWALGSRDLPACDVQEHPFKVAKDLGVLLPEPPAILASSLRGEAELQANRMLLLAIHWRLVEARLEPNKVVDMRAMAEKDFLKGFDWRQVPLLDFDLSFEGEPVSKLSQSRLQIAQSIARERHHAANWLLGVHPHYSMVVTPT